ncbi:MAG: hypothetical protein AAF810_11250 [Cyanobacteria bacterium P01_D01_bin.36]
MTPDGQTVVAGIRNGDRLTMMVWDLSLDTLLKAGCEHIKHQREQESSKRYCQLNAAVNPEANKSDESASGDSDASESGES